MPAMHWANSVIRQLLQSNNRTFKGWDEKMIEKVLGNARISGDEFTSGSDLAYQLELIQLLVREVVIDKFGLPSIDEDKIYPTPYLSRSHTASQVTQMLATETTPAKYIVVLGTSVYTWEQLFYEMAHECVHLLGPVDSNKYPVSTIEEGVAVKFAEDFIHEYVSPHTSNLPHLRVSNSPGNNYSEAYQITSKIPYSVLVTVKDRFGVFSLATNPALYSITKDFISELEASVLCRPFQYARQAKRQ